jgi:hypothetical protein
MATVSLIDPYSQQAEEIARRKRMAQALQEQGSQVLEMPTTPGVLISPYAGLGKLLQAGIGAYKEKKANEDYAKLQNEYRTNYNTQLGEMARLISAPEVKGVSGTNEIPYEPAQTEKIYGTKPAPVMGSGYGSGMLMPDQVIGEKVIKPEVPYQAAVAPVEARPAGYISAADLQKIDIPEVKQLLMAKYLQQFEPKAPIKGSPGDVFFDPITGKERFSVKPTTTPQRGVAMSPGQELRDPITGALLATATAKTEATALSPLGKLQAERAAIAASNPNDPRLTSYDSAIANEVRNVAAERLAWEQKNPDYKQVTVDMKDGSKALMKMDREGRVTPLIDIAGEAVVSAAPSKKVRVEVTNADGSTKMVLMDESDPKFVEGFATKGPEYASITTVNAQGETVVRQVKKDDPILATGYVKPLDGFLGQLQQAGVPMGTIRSDPKIRDLVDRYFVKTAGGVAPEEAAGFELRKAEVVARLGELGIAIPANIKGLSLSATPGVLGGTQPASAASASTTGANDIKSKVEAGGLKYEPTKYDYRINADGSVQRKAK